MSDIPIPSIGTPVYWVEMKSPGNLLGERDGDETDKTYLPGLKHGKRRRPGLSTPFEACEQKDANVNKLLKCCAAKQERICELEMKNAGLCQALELQRQENDRGKKAKAYVQAIKIDIGKGVLVDSHEKMQRRLGEVGIENEQLKTKLQYFELNHEWLSNDLLEAGEQIDKLAAKLKHTKLNYYRLHEKVEERKLAREKKKHQKTTVWEGPAYMRHPMALEDKSQRAIRGRDSSSAPLAGDLTEVRKPNFKRTLNCTSLAAENTELDKQLSVLQAQGVRGPAKRRRVEGRHRRTLSDIMSAELAKTKEELAQKTKQMASYAEKNFALLGQVQQLRRDKGRVERLADKLQIELDGLEDTEPKFKNGEKALLEMMMQTDAHV